MDTLLENLGTIAVLGGSASANDNITAAGATMLAAAQQQENMLPEIEELVVQGEAFRLSQKENLSVYYVADSLENSEPKLFSLKSRGFMQGSFKFNGEVEIPSMRQWSSRVFEIEFPSKRGKFAIIRGIPEKDNNAIIIEIAK